MTPTPPSTARAHTEGTSHHARPRRADLEGLRGLAIGLVVVYHLGQLGVSGGVDVFLFLSGFFVLGSLARSVIRGDRIDVLDRWRRTLRRLVPPAWLTVVVVLAAGAVLLPRRDLLSLLQQSLSSMGYVENLWLTQNGLQYGATTSLANPFQHFWSLSVQGQILLAGPLVAWAASALTQRWTRGRATVVVAVLSVATGGGLALAAVLVSQNQAAAYLSTAARLWEFLLGGLLAVVLPPLRLSQGLRSILGWIGLIAILATGVVLDPLTTFPGPSALLPLGGASLVIIAGTSRTVWGVDRLLSLRPVAASGRYAYGLYLWHWPVFVLALAAFGRIELGLRGAILIVLVSAALAAFTYHVVERRRWTNAAPSSTAPGTARTARRRLTIATVGGLLAILVTGTVAEGHRVASVLAAEQTFAPGRYPGARVFTTASLTEVPAIPPLPDPSVPHRVALYTGDGETGCSMFGPEPGFHCRFDSIREYERMNEPDFTIAVVGGSHAAQTVVPILEELGDSVLIREYIRAGCPFFLAPPDVELTFEIGAPGNCARWNDAVLESLLDVRPDLVVLALTRASGDERVEFVPPEYVVGLERLADAGLTILAVRMTPAISAPDWHCIADAVFPEECVLPRSAVIGDDSLVVDLLPLSGVTVLDTTPYWCPDGLCPSSIGNVSVYLDPQHLSDAYVRSMGFAFRDAITPLLEDAH